MPNAVILGKTGVAGYLSGQIESPVVLSKDEAMQLILELHSDQHSVPTDKSSREKILTVWDWIRDDPLTKHHDQWEELKKALVD